MPKPHTDRALAHALEPAGKGAPVDWENPKSGARGSVVVQWHDVPAAMPSLAQFLDDQLPQMRASLTVFELVERGNAGTNEAPLPYLDCRVQGTEPLRQLVMGRVIDGQVVLVTGSAREAWFAALKPAFLDVIRSVRAP